MRRAIGEMRKLQTERDIRTGLGLADNIGLGDLNKITATIAKHQPKPESEPEVPEDYDDVDPFTLNLHDPEQ